MSPGQCELHKCDLLTQKELEYKKTKKEFERKNGRSIVFEIMAILGLMVSMLLTGYDFNYLFGFIFFSLQIIQKLKYQKDKKTELE